MGRRAEPRSATSAATRAWYSSWCRNAKDKGRALSRHRAQSRGIVTDATAGRILDLMIRSQQGEYGPALVTGTEAIASTVAKGFGHLTPPSPRPIHSKAPRAVRAAFRLGNSGSVYPRVLCSAHVGARSRRGRRGGRAAPVTGDRLGWWWLGGGFGGGGSVVVGEGSAALVVVAGSVAAVREGASDEQRRRATAPVISDSGRSGRVGQLRCRTLWFPRPGACIAAPLGREPAPDSGPGRRCEAASLGPRVQRVGGGRAAAADHFIEGGLGAVGRRVPARDR